MRLDNIRVSGHVAPVYSSCRGKTFSAAGLGDWSFTSTGGATNPGDGGNGGGFCQVSDASGVSSAYVASGFLGNWYSPSGSGYLTIDLRLLSAGGALIDVPEFIRLSGPGGTAVAAMPAAELPPIGRLWKTITFPLTAAAWTVTAGSWDALLMDVSECRLQLEFSNSTETIGVDNFGRLTAGCPPPDLPIVVSDPGVELCEVLGFAGISTVALNPADGLLYGTIDSASGSCGGLWALAGPAAGMRLAAYALPAHLIFDASGAAFTTEDTSGEIYHDASGSGSTLWVSGFHSGDDDPSGLCFAPPGFSGPNVNPGDILVADCGYNGQDDVWAFSAAVAEDERLVMPHPGDRDFRDIASGRPGQVYLAGTVDPNTITILAPDGTTTTLTLSVPLTNMVGIDYDAVMDRIYVIEQGGNSLRWINPTTGSVTLVADGFAGFTYCGIEIDAAGRRLWVVDAGAGRVYEFCLASALGAGEPGASPLGGLLGELKAWPNPAPAAIGISFALASETDARLEVYDLAGRFVRSLVAGRQPAGERTLRWDGRDARGRRVASGIYLLRLSTAGEERSARLVLLR